jgi:hypothetical protein
MLGQVGYRVIWCWVILVIGSYQSGRLRYRVILGFESYQFELGQISGHLMTDHFGFWVILSRVRSDIESYSVGLFRILSYIRSVLVRYWIIQYQIISNFKSYRILMNRTDLLNPVGFFHIQHTIIFLFFFHWILVRYPIGMFTTLSN